MVKTTIGISDSQCRQQELANKNIGSLLFQYALPAIVAMSATSIYNICDSIFIGQGINALAIAGLAVSLPLMHISSALGAMFGAGASALTSINMGQKNQIGALQVLGNMLRLDVFVSILFSVLGLCFLEPILRAFGASDSTLPYAMDYMTILLIGNVISHMFFGLNTVVRSSGNPKKAMTAQLIAVGLNLLLDYVFIFICGWGIKGAAWATVAGQLAALIYDAMHFLDKSNFVYFDKVCLKCNFGIIREIVYIGLSPFFLNLCTSLIVIAINNLLHVYCDGDADLYIGAYGIVNRFILLLSLVVAGIAQGMQPIASFNYGAKQYQRVNRVLVTAMVWGMGFLLVGTFLSELWAERIISIFTPDVQLIQVASHVLRCIVFMYPAVAIVTVSTTFFQAVRHPKYSIFLSVTRQLLFLLPLLFLMSHCFGAEGLCYAMPISDLLSAILAFILLLRKGFEQRRRVLWGNHPF